MLTGVLVGVAFGVSGQIFQRLVRNPLASPDILGVSSGARARRVRHRRARRGRARVTVAALGGAVAAVGAIYLLGLRQGMSSYRLVLVGIGITAMLDAASPTC